MMGHCDLDDVNCMETLDRKISVTDEELVNLCLPSKSSEKMLD